MGCIPEQQHTRPPDVCETHMAQVVLAAYPWVRQNRPGETQQVEDGGPRYASNFGGGGGQPHRRQPSD